MSTAKTYIVWLFWCLWYLPDWFADRFRREPQMMNCASWERLLQRSWRTRRPWWTFKPHVWHNDSGRWWDVYFDNTGHYVTRATIPVEIFVDFEDTRIVGLRVFDESLPAALEEIKRRREERANGIVPEDEQIGSYLVQEARRNGACRVCGERITPEGAPLNWGLHFGEMLYPQKVTLNFGEEFAHTDCLEAEAKVDA